MADEVNFAFLLAGEPAANIAAWRADPPPFLADYKLMDESYESLVYEANVTTHVHEAGDVRIGQDPLPADVHVPSDRRRR